MDPPDNSDPALVDRIKSIVNAERQIDELMRCSKEILSELSKEKQITKNRMDETSQQFRKLITSIDTELTSQLKYLSHVCVGSAHQGSTFGIQQNSCLAQTGCFQLHENLEQIVDEVLKLDKSEEVVIDEMTSGSESQSPPNLQPEGIAVKNDDPPEIMDTL